MRGTYFLGARLFETREMQLPQLEMGEVLIRIAACGVCGTDVHIYHGGKGSADVKPPIILGHEISGIVEQVGKGVTTVAVSDHVAVDPNIYCNKCTACHTGKKQVCRRLKAIGVTRDGGFADYCIVPQEQCFRVDNAISLEHAAMAEPLACCLHGIDRANIRPGSMVCIIGGGAIGLMMVQLAKLSGAGCVILSEPNAMRRKIGLQVGADAVIDPSQENLPVRFEELTGLDGADVVIECVGNPAATAQAFSVAGTGATILLFSVPKEGTTYPLSLEDVYHKEWTIAGSLINPDTHERAVRLLASRRLLLDPIITHAYPIERLEDAIFMQMSDQSIKVIVKPDLREPEVLRRH